MVQLVQGVSKKAVRIYCQYRPVGAAYNESKAGIKPIKHCDICAMFVT